MKTKPAEDQEQESAAAHLIIAPLVEDETTGAMWVHKDYEKVRGDWENEAHVPQVSADEQFGDVASWVAYVQKFGSEKFLTWSASGLSAILDYHSEDPGRCQWKASQPFIASPEWSAWTRFSNGTAHSQREAIEFLEDHAKDIKWPDAAGLMGILRNLRANVSAKAVTELKADGGTSVSFNQEKTIQGGANAVELPTEMTIGIPILKGHTDEAGKAVKYELALRIRASVDDSVKLTLRFTIPAAEKAQEKYSQKEWRPLRRCLETASRYFVRSKSLAGPLQDGGDRHNLKNKPP